MRISDWISDVCSSDLVQQDPSTIEGTPGNDFLEGTSGDDHIRGLAGNDAIFGLAGDDFLEGDDDSDSLHGDDGDDTLYGGDGIDNLTGGEGNDLLDGGGGEDIASYFDPAGGGIVDLGQWTASDRSEEHKSERQSPMRTWYGGISLKKKNKTTTGTTRQ